MLASARNYEMFEEEVTVHLVHHSHDDVGWLETVDEYYYGDKNAWFPIEIRKILDSVISELVDHP